MRKQVDDSAPSSALHEWYRDVEIFSSQHSVHVVPLPHHQLKDTDVRVTKMTSSTLQDDPTACFDLPVHWPIAENHVRSKHAPKTPVFFNLSPARAASHAQLKPPSCEHRQCKCTRTNCRVKRHNNLTNQRAGTPKSFHSWCVHNKRMHGTPFSYRCRGAAQRGTTPRPAHQPQVSSQQENRNRECIERHRHGKLKMWTACWRMTHDFPFSLTH